ncbi:MAG: YdcF family protein [Candidatus Pacebacteria bacterium]|nr:YdcF family protein [Candidatus Paceibacterota bacterium]
MNTVTAKHLLIINGVQFKKNLSPDREFIARLEKAADFIKHNPIDSVVISGGFTRKGCPSEASFGKQYLKKHTNIPIYKEEGSYTTIENIKFTKKIFVEFDKITVITTTGRLTRLKYLYQTIWKETAGKIEFIITPHSQHIFLPLLETFYLLYSWFDIHEKILPRVAKRILRNK